MPPTRRLVPLIALFAGAAVALAGCATTVDGTGVGPSGSPSAPGSSQPTVSSSSASAPSGTPAGDTPASDTPAGSGREVETDWFTLDLPSGWSPADSQQSAIIGFYVGPRVDGFTVNVNIVREDAQGATLDAYRAKTLSNLQTKLPIRDLSETSDLTVDGEAGVAYDFRSTIGSLEVRQGQVITLHDGYGYVVTYSASAASFTQYSSAARTIVTSLRWR